MKKKLLIPFLVLLTITGLCTSAMAGEHGHNAHKKVGILLVAFGSSLPRAQVSFDNIDKKVKATYPEFPVRWAGMACAGRGRVRAAGATRAPKAAASLAR